MSRSCYFVYFSLSSLVKEDYLHPLFYLGSMASSSSSAAASGKGFALKLSKLRNAPKAVSSVLFGSHAWNNLLSYTGLKIIQEIEKLSKEDPKVKPTPLAEFIASLGVCLTRIIGVRLNRWGKIEVQSKEAFDLLVLQKATPEEKDTLSWVPLPISDPSVQEFLKAKMDGIASQETGNTSLDAKEQFFLKVHQVSKGKLYNGYFPIFANYQLIQINYPKEKAAASAEGSSSSSSASSKKRKDREGEGEGEEQGKEEVAKPKAKRGKKTPPATPAAADASADAPTLSPDLWEGEDGKGLIIGTDHVVLV